MAGGLFALPPWLSRQPCTAHASSSSAAIYQPLSGGDDDDELSVECSASGATAAAATIRASSQSSSSSSSRYVEPPPRDAAAQLLARLGRPVDEHIRISLTDDARVLRRIDLAMLPLMLSVYFLQALDKATLSYASIFGLIDDAQLVGNQFSWLGSVVFVAQLAAQLPVSLALVKLPIGKFTSAMVLAWGLSLAAMAWARDFTHLMIARFLLGTFEASVGPSFVAMTQMWWRRREQTLRIGSWYCMNGLTWVLGSLITYGLAKIESPMKSYQVIFLFFGIITVIVALVMFFYLPDSPTEARFLSDNDKVLAIERLRHNQMGVMSREWRYDHFSEALRDTKTWLWFAMIFCVSVPSNGISTFGPLVIQSFVSDPFSTILANIPIGISHVVVVSVSAYASMRWKLKGPVIAVLCVPPIMGLLVLLHFPHDADHRAILLAGYFGLSTFTGITPLIYSWSSQNTAGDTKRKTSSAIIFIGASAGNVVGPLLFRPDEAPSYTRGIRTNIVLFTAVILFDAGTSCYLFWLNSRHSRRRVALGKLAIVADPSLETAAEAERMEEQERAHLISHPKTRSEPNDEDLPCTESAQDMTRRGNKAFRDATDLENEDFVYVY